MTTLFSGLFDTATATNVQVSQFVICIIAALLIGAIIAATCMQGTRTTRSFLLTLCILPAIVCVVIMMVNGNVGAGVAVAGAFSLVRFRSIPGTAREIAMLFLAMGAGLIVGMGYLGYAILFTVILCLVCLAADHLDLGLERRAAAYRTIRVTIPEDLDYTGIFDDIWADFTAKHTLTQVKSTNMGSMFRLTYDITLKDAAREKEMIDAIRCRNGNLEITVSGQETASAEL